MRNNMEIIVSQREIQGFPLVLEGLLGTSLKYHKYMMITVTGFQAHFEPKIYCSMVGIYQKKTFATLSTNLQTLKPLYVCTGILSTGPLCENTSVCFLPRFNPVGSKLLVSFWWCGLMLKYCDRSGVRWGIQLCTYATTVWLLHRAPPPCSNHLDSLQVLWTRRVRDESCVCEQTDVEKLLMRFSGNPLERMCDSGL